MLVQLLELATAFEVLDLLLEFMVAHDIVLRWEAKGALYFSRFRVTRWLA